MIRYHLINVTINGLNSCMAILECELHIQILLLYLQATFKGWMDIMYAAVDSVNVSIGQYNTNSTVFKAPEFRSAIFK